MNGTKIHQYWGKQAQIFPTSPNMIIFNNKNDGVIKCLKNNGFNLRGI